jgi:hypothetical protein
MDGCKFDSEANNHNCDSQTQTIKLPDAEESYRYHYQHSVFHLQRAVLLAATPPLRLT